MSSRSLLACIPCRKSKVRCDGANPCRRCSRSDLSCIYINPKARTRYVAHSPTVPPVVEAADVKLVELERRVKAVEQHEETLRRHEDSIKGILAALSGQTCSPFGNTNMGNDIGDLNVQGSTARAVREGGWSVQPSASSSTMHASTPFNSIPWSPTPRHLSLLSNERSAVEHHIPGQYLSQQQLGELTADVGFTFTSRNSRMAFEVVDQPSLIQAGILTLEQANVYYQLYQKHSAHRIAAVRPIAESPKPNSLLHDVILTLGAVSAPSSPTSHDLTQKCMSHTRCRMFAISKIDIDDVHAAAMFAAWFSDVRVIRAATGWAYELGLHRSFYALRRLRKQPDHQADLAVVSQKMAQLTMQLRVWLSCCNVELILCLYSDSPIHIGQIEGTLNEALHWFSLLDSKRPIDTLMSSFVTDLDFRLVSYAQLTVILTKFRDALPPFFTELDSALSTVTDEDDRDMLALIEEYENELSDWEDNWHAGLDIDNADLASFDDPGLRTAQSLKDRNRLGVPLAFARCYFNSFALRGISRISPPSKARSAAVGKSLEQALEVVRITLAAESYRASLYSHMHMSYMLRHAFGFALGFIFAAVAFAPHIASSYDIHTVLKRLGDILGSISDTGVNNEVRSMQERLRILVKMVNNNSDPLLSHPSIVMPTAMMDSDMCELITTLFDDQFLQSQMGAMGDL